MELISYILMAVSVGVFLYNVIIYQKNARYEFRDEMGTSMTFSSYCAISIIVLSISLFIHPAVKWYWGLIDLIFAGFAHLILRPLTHYALKIFKLVGRKN